MNKILTGLALACLAAPAFAQGTLISPPMASSSEGTYYSYYMGRYPAMKHQIVDSWHRGKTADIKQIAFRIDGTYNYTTTYGMGRTYSNVTLDIGDGDFDTFARYTASNFTSTPARVFSGSVTWPTLSGLQPIRPGVWGGISGDYRFPFSSPWKYSGKTDIVTEFGFSGGTLQNGGTWSATSSKYYRFDGVNSSTSSSYVTVSSLPVSRLNNNSSGVTTRCNDSEHGTRTTGAYAYIYAYVYGKYYSNRNWAGKMRFYTQSYYTGFENPVIHALGFQANETGLDLNTGCNKLHINGPMVLMPTSTFPESVSTSGYSGYYEQFIPWNPVYGAKPVICQAAWSDSSTGQLALSQARHILTPVGMPESFAYKKKGTYTYSTSSTSGPSTSALYHPAVQYTY